ncbi:NADPH-dependent F420 reductase [Planctomycetaceae bacterium SH139]
MDIAIIGTGNVGSVLGRRLAAAGHQITFGSRDPASARVLQLVAENELAHQARNVAAAVASTDLVILATPYDYLETTLTAAGDLAGKTVVDCSNPLTPSFDGLQLGFDCSAAERVAALVPDAHVVKAFNTASVSTMADPHYGSQQATMFYCGDNAAAKQRVHALIEDLQMEPVDSGPLANARYLEPMAMLYIHLAVQQGWGGNCALKMLKRESKLAKS